MGRKGSLQVKVELCQRVFYSDAFLVKSILTKRHVCAQGGVLRHQIWTVNQVNHNDWPKENLEEMPHESNSNCHKGKTQQLRNSPSESARVSIHKYCTLFLLINTLPASLLCLCGNSFLKSWRPEPESVLFPLWPSPISGWEPKPCSKSLQVEATWDHISLIFFGKDSFIFWLLPHLIKVVSQSNLRGCLPDWNP